MVVTWKVDDASPCTRTSYAKTERQHGNKHPEAARPAELASEGELARSQPPSCVDPLFSFPERPPKPIRDV